VKEVAERGFEGTTLEGGIVFENASSLEDVGFWGVWKIPAAKTRVVAIRGTWTLKDSLADLALWGFAGALRLATWFVPLRSSISPYLINRLFWIFDIPRVFGVRNMWEDVLEATRHAIGRSLDEDYHTIVTGHSLGGGLAQIVASQLQIPGLGFSPVGTKFSMARFGMQKRATYRTMTAVMPEYDMVDWIDDQMGFRQKVECRLPKGMCHYLRPTICELYRSCGDSRGRNMTETCMPLMDDWQGLLAEEAKHKAERMKMFYDIRGPHGVDK